MIVALGLALLLSSSPREETDWATPDRAPPHQVVYVTTGLSLGTAVGLGVGLLAVHQGVLLGDSSGFVDLRPLMTPIAFALGGGVVGSLVGWTLFQLRLADFNRWQRDQVSLNVSADPTTGDWRLSLARAW